MKNNNVLKAFRQSKSVLNHNVVSCFKSDINSIKCALMHLKTLFDKKGIENDSSKLVNEGLESFDSWETYYDILRFEILKYKNHSELLQKEVDKLREDNRLLKNDAQMNNFNSK